MRTTVVVRTVRRWLCGVVAGTVLVACGGGDTPTATPAPSFSVATGLSSTAVHTCTTTGKAFVDQEGQPQLLSGAYQSTAVAVAQWQQNRSGPNGPHATSGFIASLPPTEQVDVCYFDGTFTGIPKGPPPAPGVSPAPADYTRVIVEVSANHGSELDGAGYARSPGAGYSSLAITGPAGSS